MSYYARRERERDYGYGDVDYDDTADEYASHYPRSHRSSRNSNSFSQPVPGGSGAYEFSRQRSWAGPGSAGSTGRSYDERERAYSFQRGDVDGYSSSPRTPTTYDVRGGSGGGGGPGSTVSSTAHRRSRDMGSRSSPREREEREMRERERAERERERAERNSERGERNGRNERNERNERGERDYYQQRERRQDRARRRMRAETNNYPRRLREYLQPILQSQDGMDHAVEVFVKLEEDARYLTRSVGALLESLAAVADVASTAKGGDGTGLDDPHTDSELTEESTLDDSETAAESAESDSDDEAEPGANGGSTAGIGARRRSSAAGYGSGGMTDLQRRRSSMDVPPVFMQWGELQPYALSKAPEGINDRRKSYLAFTQTIGVSLLTLNLEGSRRNSTNLSTKGLLGELVRVLQPHDYRAYFRAAARVILLPPAAALRRPDEMALEAIERQLLGTAKFGQALSGAPMTNGNGSTAGTGAAHSTPPTMMACITYSSSNYGCITLYRLDMGTSREGGDWPRRMQPVAAMTGVPKELLRRSVRAMPPSRRTVLKVRSITEQPGRGSGSDRGSDRGDRSDREKGDKDKADKDKSPDKSADKSEKDKSCDKSCDKDKSGQGARLRWVSLPGDTTAPSLGYSPNVGRSTLSGSLRAALGIEADDLHVGSGTTANIVHATVPAMVAWLHVRAAYLVGVDFEATEVQRGSSSSKSSGSSAVAAAAANGTTPTASSSPRDDASSTASQRPRMRRIVRCKRGPRPIEHEGRDPCIVVLHPSRGEWVTAPVYWTEAKEVKE